MTFSLSKSIRCLALGLAASVPLMANAELNIVTTTTGLGMLAHEVGGQHVEVTVLASPDRDTHYLNARPSFMAALRKADMLIEMGAGLEEGWLPAAQRGAANPRINSGRNSHFVAADQLHLRRSITQDGPNIGHVHGQGNPHFSADPNRMATLAIALGKRLAQLDPEQTEYYQEQAKQLAKTLRQQAKSLARDVESSKIVVYHEDLDYLEEWLPVEVVGYLEAIPGVPPTASHLNTLVQELAGTSGRIMYARYQPEKGALFLQSKLNWDVHAVNLEPQEATLESYLELLNSWVSALGKTNDSA